MKKLIRILLLITFALAMGRVYSAPMQPLNFECAGSSISAEFISGSNSDLLGAIQTRLTVISDRGEKTILNFFSGSFGVECRSNSLGWRGYVVFQTACPARPSPKDPAEPCDFDNYFGIIKGSETLLVPHEKNGKLAAQLFDYPSKSQKKLKPVATQFNIHDH